MSNIISRMEAHPRFTQQFANRSQVQHTRPFQHRILQRKNIDRQIQPLLMIDDQYPKETIPVVTNDINFFEDSSSENDIIPITQY